MSVPHLDRRAVLGCAALCGVAGPILAGCSSGSSDAGGDGGGAAAETSSPPVAAGTALVATADVPVGEGVTLTDAGVVVTQPSRGDFKAFSNVCTHQGCVVDEVTAGEIRCPCHGSAFDVSDGSVVTGPATNPLPEVKVAVEGDQVVRA